MKQLTKICFSTINAFNAHTILGLGRLADEKQIKRAYYSLAKLYHPDSNPGQDTSQQFQRITKAYDFLIKEASQRAKQSQPKNHHQNRNHNPNPKQQQYTFHRNTQQSDKDSQDKMFKAYQAFKKKHNIRNDRFDKFMEFYQEYTQMKRKARKEDKKNKEEGNQKEQSRQQQQQDEQEEQQEEDEQIEEQGEQEYEESEEVEYAKYHRQNSKKLQIAIDLQLSPEQAKAGTDKRLKVWKKVTCTTCKGHPPRREIKCKKCNGSGIHVSKKEIGCCWCCGGARTVSKHECAGCGGKGFVSRQSEEMVHIRSGVQNHEEVVFRGKGHQHLKKGFFGDLIVKIRISGSKEQSELNGLKKIGFNTYETVKISVIEAVLGTKLKYHTVWGEKTMPMRGGVQDGFMIKRNGQGCRKKSTNDNGHHFITITIEVPVKLSVAETQIYQRIREIYKTHRHKQYHS